MKDIEEKNKIIIEDDNTLFVQDQTLFSLYPPMKAACDSIMNF